MLLTALHLIIFQELRIKSALHTYIFGICVFDLFVFFNTFYTPAAVSNAVIVLNHHALWPLDDLHLCKGQTIQAKILIEVLFFWKRDSVTACLTV